MRGVDNRWCRGGRGSNRRGGFNRGGFGRGGPRGRGFGGHRDGNRFNSQNQWQNRIQNDFPGIRLSEDQIGVTKYMSEHEGFNGIIKSRYSDFQVSEINLQGEVAELTNTTPPEPPTDALVEDDEELLLTKYNVEILPMATWDRINKVAVGTDLVSVEIDVTESSKEERTKIHVAVKKAFGDSIVGSTLNIDDKKFVRFEKYRKGVRIDNRVKWVWPGEFVHFLVHKENCDTMDAACKVADRLRTHIRPSMIGYAGTKDRRAKTTQWFSVRKTDPKKIANACQHMREMTVGNYSFHDHHLKLGMLKGNKFRIALRNVTADDSVVSVACSRLAERGFINYYGLQRFGTRVEVPTYDVGKKLLRGQFQEAIDSILSPREGPLQEALSLYRLQGPVFACQALPRYAHSQLEAKLIQALVDSPNDLYYAMQKIPRNTRLLYLHSYQSLIWNRCVSERIQRLGLRPAVGDLVPLHPHRVTEEIDDDESDSEETTDNSENSKISESIDNHAESKPSETIDNAEKKPESKKREKEKVPVKVLTQEDIDGASYTIFDIIMPLPGYLIEYPPNMRDYYEKLLTEDGLKLDLKHKNKSYCLSGAYRSMCVHPGGVSWQCVRYASPDTDLILSDRDRLEGRTLTGVVDDGAYKALIVTFSLPPSCYATMALRELIRSDTSAQHQALQNNYHKRTATDDEPGGSAAKQTREGD